ncbi:MAG: cytochrome c-type biogenesis protein [Candidatus Micropelagos sp.]|jgi:cytochrome c-type biogenesis protein CcmH|uniref:Cytochrome c-type biogenesis protein n=1 Tax=PS1 clade bacterium TaxID=2175152 RepID=A0A368EL63_9PROT|nr:cytochrome c-type biogenesis protein CcmH [Hyphomicrobiales bacterium]NCG10505.1 cytochrome c-type biogenesis protein CcmH [Alphaproteobacteria bacterium]OUV48615.1 MAG: cytochrome c-type biogenesis protein CcmH [Alphaproteobacteria bacterium TMED110]RCL84591.1 MAG: cytochrome c-type biogenesis protein CcmH [PS1 clade bacterium]|tara:strand:+ start:157 stop:570 length:414 start_codon:yes stop_codon:yes gene_type:complete
MTIRVASKKFNFLLISIYLCTYPVLAISPGEAFKDEALEARARSLSMELRCMVCQNQSIDDSDAPLAKDLRMLIREQIKAGKTDDEILVFIEDRYGEFALLKPRFDIKNAPLWALPFLLILAGIFLMRSFFRNAPKN